MKKVLFISILLFSFVATGVVLYWWFFLQGQRFGIAARPPEIYKSQPIQLVDTINYQQRDPAWKEDQLGKTDETLGSVGCTVSSIAMALKNLGFDFTPKTLNAELTKHDSFTPRGWIYWEGIKKVTNNAAEALVFSEPSHQAIDACMTTGKYPIVKFMIHRIIPHWVIVTGRTENDYLVHDPLVPAQTPLKPIALSSRTNTILSVRCIGKTKQ